MVSHPFSHSKKLVVMLLVGILRDHWKAPTVIQWLYSNYQTSRWGVIYSGASLLLPLDKSGGPPSSIDFQWRRTRLRCILMCCLGTPREKSGGSLGALYRVISRALGYHWKSLVGPPVLASDPLNFFVLTSPIAMCPP